MFYKMIENEEIISVGSTSAQTLPEGFKEITETEYNELLAEILANAPQEEETEEISEYDEGFNEGYEQAILDMLELELEEESEE